MALKKKKELATGNHREKTKSPPSGFVSIHDDMPKAYTSTIQNPEGTPQWLTEGLTYLLPKTKETTNPENYITGL